MNSSACPDFGGQNGQFSVDFGPPNRYINYNASAIYKESVLCPELVTAHLPAINVYLIMRIEHGNLYIQQAKSTGYLATRVIILSRLRNSVKHIVGGWTGNQAS